MKFCDLKGFIPNWQSVKLVGFEYLDHEEYEMARYDGKNSIPKTFDEFNVVSIESETDDGDVYIRVRVDTATKRINDIIFEAYTTNEFSTAEIRDQDGNLVDSIEIPQFAPVEWIDTLFDRPIFKNYFEAVKDSLGILEFTIYREEI